MTFFDIDNHKIFYTDTGGEKPALIFSHGFFLDQSSFNAQYAYFQENYRCIGWDEMGFGQSTTSNIYSYWDSANIVLAIMDELGIEQASLIGVSKGGFISLRAALTAPARVKSLILIGTESGVFGPEQQADFTGLIDAWGQLSADELAEPMAFIGETYFGDDDQKFAWIETWRNRDRSQIKFPGHALLNRDDITDRMSEISCPSLVIHGSNDQAIEYAKGQALAEAIPNGHLFSIDGGPHGPNATHAKVVNAKIAEFLANL